MIMFCIVLLFCGSFIIIIRPTLISILETIIMFNVLYTVFQFLIRVIKLNNIIVLNNTIL